MIYKTKTRRKEWTAKDFVMYWARKYQEKMGRRYFINFMKEGAAMKRLMGDLTDRELKALIDAAFEDPNLKRQGYPISLLPYSVNKLMPQVDNPGSSIPDWELELDVPVAQDKRTAWLWKRIKDRDYNSIVKVVTTKEPWLVLMGKLQHEKGFVPELVQIYYEKWRMRESIKREGVK